MIGIIVYNRIKKPVRKIAIMCTIYAITLIKFQKHVCVAPQQLLLKRVQVAFVSYK